MSKLDHVSTLCSQKTVIASDLMAFPNAAKGAARLSSPDEFKRRTPVYGKYLKKPIATRPHTKGVSLSIDNDTFLKVRQNFPGRMKTNTPGILLGDD